MEEEKKIILFDGVCNLCNGAVIFTIERDKNNLFHYAALQSAPGRKLIAKHGIDTSKTDSIILVDGDEYYIKSSAALRIARHLSGGYPLLYGFMILPKLIRDRIYDIVAHNRYKWFGRKESCMVPTPELKAKFLHEETV